MRYSFCQVGDILLEINGRNVEDASHTQAINLIRKAESEVQILLKPGDGIVPDIGKLSIVQNTEYHMHCTIGEGD